MELEHKPTSKEIQQFTSPQDPSDKNADPLHQSFNRYMADWRNNSKDVRTQLEAAAQFIFEQLTPEQLWQLCPDPAGKKTPPLEEQIIRALDIDTWEETPTRYTRHCSHCMEEFTSTDPAIRVCASCASDFLTDYAG